MRQRAIAARPAAQRIRPVPSPRRKRAIRSCSWPARTRRRFFAQLDLPYIPPELREDHGEFAAGGAGRVAPADRMDRSAGRAAQPLELERRPQHARRNRRTTWTIWASTTGPSPTTRSRPFRRTASMPRVCESRSRKSSSSTRSWPTRAATSACSPASEVDILRGQAGFRRRSAGGTGRGGRQPARFSANNEAENTKRLIRAAENQFVHMLGHLTGRLLLEREPYPVNQQAVIDACAETGTWIELNCNPLPLRSRLAALALREEQRREVRHQPRRAPQRTRGLPAPRRRRGPQRLADKADVINTLPLETLRQELNRKRARH